MIRRLRRWRDLLLEAFGEWSDDHCSQLGAALAFYAFFSMAPLLLIAIAVAGLAFGRQAAEGRIVAQLQSFIGSQSARAVETLIARASAPQARHSAGVVGVITLFVGASGIVQALQESMNAIWKAPSRSGVLPLVGKYAFSYAMVLALGVLTLVSLGLSAGIAIAAEMLRGALPYPQFLLQAVNTAATIALVAVVFMMMFKFLPDVPVPWRDAWAGGLTTSLLLEAGKLVLSRYLGGGGVRSAYGAAGSLVVVLLWVYYSAQILYFAVELTKVRVRRREREKDAGRRHAVPGPG